MAAKVRVAPLSAVSIPRLELMEAVIALRSSEAIDATVRVSLAKFFFWTDSMDTIYWIHGMPRSLKPFVAHRVSEIQEKSDHATWRYAPTELNAADVATRGCTIEVLKNGDWFVGPESIRQEVEFWPVQPGQQCGYPCLHPSRAAKVEEKPSLVQSGSTSLTETSSRNTVVDKFFPVS